MIIVLDTNVLLSGLLFPGGIPDKIVRAALTGRFQNATSPDLLTELRRVLARKFALTSPRIEEIVEVISGVSEVVYPTERLDVIKEDEKDNRVLECAVTAKAEAIVSGDLRHLVKLKSFRTISILSPLDFSDRYGIL